MGILKLSLKLIYTSPKFYVSDVFSNSKLQHKTFQVWTLTLVEVLLLLFMHIRLAISHPAFFIARLPSYPPPASL